MRLTNYSDYALRTLMYLAVMPDRHTLANISDIANSYQISRSHLTKVIHQLAQIGYIESIRGKNGGIRLAKDPTDINLGDVIRQTEPDFDIVPCMASGHTVPSKSVTTTKNTQNLAVSLAKAEVVNLDNSANKSKFSCEISPVCRLKSVFDEATRAFINVLHSYTLADIVENEAVLWQMLQVKPL